MNQKPSDMIPVPEHFRDDMEAFVRALDEAERLLGETGTADNDRRTDGAREADGTGEPQRRTIAFRITAIAASVALVAVLGAGIYNRLSAPKDTFDDPYLAYAAVEDALNRVSRAAGKGLALERESETYLQETLSVLNR